MISGVRLDAEGLDTLTLGSDTGFDIVSLDLGWAETRQVVNPAVDADGTDDTTQFFGARTVTLLLDLIPSEQSLWTLRRRLLAFTNARLRPTLTITPDDGSPEQQITLRRDDGSVPITNRLVTRMSVQWVAPFGILESVEEHTAVANASATASNLGRTYDLTFDRTYPASDPEGSVEVTNAGDIDAYPLVRLYGPWSGETTLINDGTGKQLVFDGENITAGNFLEVDCRARTILFNGDPADSRVDSLVIPDSQFERWTLQPGEQRIRFVPTTFTSPAQAQIVWRDAYS